MKYYGSVSDDKDLATKEYVDTHGGGGGTPEAYLKSAAVDKNTLTLTKKDDSTVSYTSLHYYMKNEVTGVAGTSSTQLSSTYDVTDANVAAYHDGMMVSFVLPVAGVTTYGSVFQVNSLGYHPVVYATDSSIGTRYPVGGQVTMIYNSVQTATAYLTKNTKITITGCWQVMDYDTSTTDARKVFDYYLRPYNGANTLYRYKLCALDKDNRIAPITITNQESATQVAKTPNSVALKTSDLWMYTSSSNISASKAVTANSLATTYYGDNMCAYNFNASIPAYRIIYLRGTYNTTNGLFTLYNDGSNPCTSYYTSVPNNTANINLSSYFVSGYYYWLVGSTYSTADYLSVFGHNPLYYFDGTNLIPYQEHLIALKQDNLVSGTNIKTVNSESILGSGDLEIAPTHQQVIDALGYTPLSPEDKGVANGIASLDSTGKVPTAQLPSYVDDVIEGYYYNNKFYSDSAHTQEITPESGKIYVDLHTNKTYRWSGSAYVEISASLVLGETSTTAYRGDRGKIAYDHSQLTSGNPHNVSKSDLGIANVENKSSATIRSEITDSNVTSALGYTPYDATNPAGYISGITGQDVSVALGYTPYDANNPNRYISGISGADVTTALGYTPYNATNPQGYISGITGSNVVAALGYTPYNNTNPNGYISGINSSDVTTALGFTPYNATNPSNYVDQNVNNLTNYFTKTEVQGMVGNRFQALIVQTLPTSDISTSTIYMVLQTGQADIYDEWMYISNTWTKIGTTSIDMSEYAKTSELHNVALTGAYSSLVGRPEIPDDTSDLTNGAGYITKSVNNLDNYTATNDLAAVALTGAYNDLTGKPTAITNVSQLANDEHYIKQSDLATTNISSLYNDVPYATLNQIQGLEDIDVEEIKKAIAAMEHIGTVTQVTAGTGLTGGGNTSVTLNHANSVTAKSGYPTGTTLENGGSFTVRDAQYDAQGHITGTQDRTITMTAIPAYDDTAVRGLISDETDARELTDARVDALEDFNKATFNSFVFCIFGIEPYIDPSTMQIVPNRYYQRSDVDTGIFMDSQKVDIHLKAWLQYHYGINTTDQLKNVTCYVYAMGDHGEYVNHMVTFWRQKSNPSITSYPHLQQVGSFSDDGYGSVHRFSTNEIGAILSSTDDGYITADPLGTGKGFVSGWNTLKGRVSTVESGKQAKLTAGTNITIDDNNVISASGGGSGTVTSVSAGTGLSISGTASVNPTVNVANTHKLPTTSEWAGKQDTLTTGLVDVVNGTTPISVAKIWIDESSSGSTIYNAAQGTPLVATNTAGMTDTGRLYVLTTNQHIYAYQNSAWTDTGMTYSGSELDANLVQGRNSYFYVDTTTGYVSVVGNIDVYSGVGGQYYRFSNAENVCQITGAGSASIIYKPASQSFYYGENQTEGVVVATTFGQNIYPKGNVTVKYSDGRQLKTLNTVQEEADSLVNAVVVDAWMVSPGGTGYFSVDLSTGYVSIVGLIDIYYGAGAKYKRLQNVSNICRITGGGTSTLLFNPSTNTITYGDSTSSGIIIATTLGKYIYPKGEVTVKYSDGTELDASSVRQAAITSNTARIEALETGGGLPAFAKSAAYETYQRMLEWAGDDSICTIAQVTDVHSADTDKYRAVGYLNEINSLFGFDLVGNFGDIGLDTTSETTTTGYELISDTKMRMKPETQWVFLKGNHDSGRVLQLSDDKISTIFNKPFAKHYSNMHESGKGYGYIDLNESKIRVVYLNTSDNIVNSYAMNATQLTWLASTLATVQAGWNVVVLSHLCVDDCGRWNSYPGDASGAGFDTLRSILAAFVAKTAGSNTSTGVSWDFTSVPSSCKLVCSFAGDSHFNNTAVTNNVRYIVRQGYGSISDSEMPSGSTKDTFDYNTQVLFDVLCIKSNGNAKVFRIGAGGDTRDLAFTF